MNFEAPQNYPMSPKTGVFPQCRLKKFWNVGIILGVLLATANIFISGMLGIIFYIFIPLFFEIPLKLSGCVGEGCWVVTIVLGSALFLIFVPLAVAFLGYLYNFKNYPKTRKKYVIISLGILFILLNVLIALLNYQSSIYLKGIRDYQTLYVSYDSMNECKQARSYGVAGACYGYFASKQNNIALCDKFLQDFEGDKEYTKSVCIEGYSIYKKDSGFCSKALSTSFEQKCLAVNYIIKNEGMNCAKLTDDFWKKQCDAGTEWNPAVRAYSKLRIFMNPQNPHF